MATTTKLGRVGLVLRGAYSASAQYDKLDVVTSNGSAYAAKQSTKGNAPPNAAYWQALADASGAAVAATSANTATANANNAAREATASKEACDAAVTALPATIEGMFSDLGLTMQGGKLCVKVERT